MFKTFVAAFVATLVLTGCGEEPENKNPAAYYNGTNQMLSWQDIGNDQFLVTDMETGCQYFYLKFQTRQFEPRIGTDGKQVCGANQQLDLTNEN